MKKKAPEQTDHHFYVDKLFNVWFRYRFTVQASTKEEANAKAMEIYSQNKLYEPICQEEYLGGTMDFIQPSAPDYLPTLEIYNQFDEKIFDNSLDYIDITDIQKPD